ncbi:AAA family ATPase [Bosea sp. NBC_00550]|uniref:AAA family ATPase n=1 Tax=Bosea sp. NBC_00550 TaxID=2969621 RepID=UPI00222FB328|nr:AAA family ATPase [Bosea sp. NBC_00550]UZF94382.1 AAA family ATPase [Bosea sp. NBC_00550]
MHGNGYRGTDEPLSAVEIEMLAAAKFGCKVNSRGRDELRLGKNDRYSVATRGEKAGVWHDFLTDEGGIFRREDDDRPRSNGHSFKTPPPRSGRAENSHADRDEPDADDEAKREAERQRSQKILGDCLPIKGSIAERYLAYREIPCPQSGVWFHPALSPHRDLPKWPALVAQPRYGDGKPTPGHHVIYLAEDGARKRDDMGKKSKLSWGEIKGGAVQLSPMTEYGHLGYAEGIETALSAQAIFGVPVWAMLGTSSDLPMPPGLKRATVFADAGQGGEEAARKRAERLVEAGVIVEIRRPLGDDDFNTDLMKNPGLTAADYPETEPINEPDADLPLRPSVPGDEAGIPQRRWLIPGLALPGQVSLIGGAAGAGKSMFAVHLSLAAAAGVDWGGWRLPRPFKVLTVNLEEDDDEMDRRFCAVRRSMDLIGTDLSPAVSVRRLADLVVARFDPKKRTVIETPRVDEIIRSIRHHGFDMVIIDPLGETFDGEENSNDQMKRIVGIWRRIARETGAAVVLVPHAGKNRNGDSGNADMVRGASAMIGVARCVVTIAPMAPDEAVKLGLPEADARRYVRIDDAKMNYSLPSAEARWFRREGITLANGPAGSDGDEVGVLEPWDPHAAFTEVSPAAVRGALDKIEAGILDKDGRPTGALWTPHNNSGDKSRWVGTLFMREFGCPEAQAKRLISDMLDSGLLVATEYSDRHRKKRVGLKINLTKWPGSRCDDGT